MLQVAFQLKVAFLESLYSLSKGGDLLAQSLEWGTTSVALWHGCIVLSHT